MSEKFMDLWVWKSFLVKFFEMGLSYIRVNFVINFGFYIIKVEIGWNNVMIIWIDFWKVWECFVCNFVIVVGIRFCLCVVLKDVEFFMNVFCCGILCVFLNCDFIEILLLIDC